MKKVISMLVLVLMLALTILPLSACSFDLPTFGVVRDTDGESFLQGYESFDGYEVELEIYESAGDMVKALEAGEVDYVLLDQIAVSEYTKENSKIKVVNYPLTDEENGSQVLLALASDTTFDECRSASDVTALLEEMQKSDLQIEWELFYNQFITYKGYETVIKGLGVTMYVAVMGLLIGIAIGTLIALVKMIPKYHVMPRILSGICDVYVGFFRGTPMVVQLLIAWFILIPAMDLDVENAFVAVLVFGMNSGAYVSEIMRSGIQAVDVGQLEAARALGLGYWTSMMKIVIPQAVKNILPTLGNEFIVLVKDTSIVSFIAVVDVTKAFRQIGDANYSYIIPYLMLALVYLVIVIIITQLIRLMERRLARSERRK